MSYQVITPAIRYDVLFEQANEFIAAVHKKIQDHFNGRETAPDILTVDLKDVFRCFNHIHCASDMIPKMSVYIDKESGKTSCLYAQKVGSAAKPVLGKKRLYGSTYLKLKAPRGTGIWQTAIEGDGTADSFAEAYCLHEIVKQLSHSEPFERCPLFTENPVKEDPGWCVVNEPVDWGPVVVFDAFYDRVYSTYIYVSKYWPPMEILEDQMIHRLAYAFGPLYPGDPKYDNGRMTYYMQESEGYNREMIIAYYTCDYTD